jgi:hypothetical protein
MNNNMANMGYHLKEVCLAAWHLVAYVMIESSPGIAYILARTWWSAISKLGDMSLSGLLGH